MHVNKHGEKDVETLGAVFSEDEVQASHSTP